MRRAYATPIYLYGLRPVMAALANPARHIHALYATEKAQMRLKAAISAIDFAKIATKVYIKQPDDMEALVGREAVHQGLVLHTAPLPTLSLQQFLLSLPSNPQLLVLLDQVTDPHNVGAVLRSCAVFGAQGIILSARNGASESATLAKSASGALEAVPVIRANNLNQCLNLLKRAGFWITGLSGDATMKITEINFSGNACLVLGSEGKGLRRLVKENCDQLVQIPMAKNPIGSLNISNAAAIGLYEASRQKLSPL